MNVELILAMPYTYLGDGNCNFSVAVISSTSMGVAKVSTEGELSFMRVFHLVCIYVAFPMPVMLLGMTHLVSGVLM